MYIIIVASITQNIGVCAEAERKRESVCNQLVVGTPLVDARLVIPAVEVAFFNVGQGNCTVVKAPNKEDIFLIDAGTLDHPHNIVYKSWSSKGASISNNAVTSSIERWISNSNKGEYRVNFILSHIDTDHQSYMSDLAQLLSRVTTEQKKYTCVYYKHPVLDDATILDSLRAFGVSIKNYDNSNEKPKEVLRNVQVFNEPYSLMDLQNEALERIFRRLHYGI